MSTFTIEDAYVFDSIIEDVTNSDVTPGSKCRKFCLKPCGETIALFSYADTGVKLRGSTVCGGVVYVAFDFEPYLYIVHSRVVVQADLVYLPLGDTCFGLTADGLSWVEEQFIKSDGKGKLADTYWGEFMDKAVYCYSTAELKRAVKATKAV